MGKGFTYEWRFKGTSGGYMAQELSIDLRCTDHLDVNGARPRSPGSDGSTPDGMLAVGPSVIAAIVVGTCLLVAAAVVTTIVCMRRRATSQLPGSLATARGTAADVSQTQGTEATVVVGRPVSTPC